MVRCTVVGTVAAVLLLTVVTVVGIVEKTVIVVAAAADDVRGRRDSIGYEGVLLACWRSATLVG